MLSRVIVTVAHVASFTASRVPIVVPAVAPVFYYVRRAHLSASPLRNPHSTLLSADEYEESRHPPTIAQARTEPL